MSEDAQLAMDEEGPKGLALYRRKRPYSINGPSDTDPTMWDVVDLLTGEQLGRIAQAESDSKNERYRIDLASQIGDDKTAGLDGIYSTRWHAADVIWEKALPLRSWAWRTIKVGVLAMDYTTRFFGIAAAFYSMFTLFRAVVWPENSKLAELGGAFVDALIRCFGTWCV